MKDRNIFKIDNLNNHKTTLGLKFVYSNGKEVLVGQQTDRTATKINFDVQTIYLEAKVGRREIHFRDKKRERNNSFWLYTNMFADLHT